MRGWRRGLDRQHDGKRRRRTGDPGARHARDEAGAAAVRRDTARSVRQRDGRDSAIPIGIGCTWWIRAGAVRATVVLADGDEPGRLAEDAAGRVHVVLRRGGAIVTVDAGSGTIIARRAVCAAARGIAYQKATDQVHVACAGGELVSLPAASGAPVQNHSCRSRLRDVVVGAERLVARDHLPQGRGARDRRGRQAHLPADARLWSGADHERNGGHGGDANAGGRPRRMAALDDSQGSVVILHQTA